MKCDRCSEKQPKEGLNAVADGAQKTYGLCIRCYDKFKQFLEGHEVLEHPDDPVPDFKEGVDCQ